MLFEFYFIVFYVGLVTLCVSRLTEDGTLVPKHVEVGS